jgi:polysaccharide export outer membrane protein
MMTIRLATAATLLLLASAASAQFIGLQHGNPPASVPTSVPPAMDRTDTLTLRPGDLCGVQVFDVPTFDYKARINDTGDLTLPLVGTLHIADLSVAAAERAIAARLAASDYIKDPQVSLQVLESPSHFATVTGEVKTPGPVPIYGEKRLLDVLSAAGGFTPASSPSITLYRRGAPQPIQIVVPADPLASDAFNIAIEPGDNIIVAKVGVVYVLGAFHSQGAIPLKTTTPLTLIQAMSMAGGVNYEAALNKAYILRSTPTGRQEISFKVSDVLHHRMADQVLQNDDIVLVPSNDLKAALKGGAAGVAASLIAGIGYLTVAR